MITRPPSAPSPPSTNAAARRTPPKPSTGCCPPAPPGSSTWAAQAWHWVDPARAVPAVARVLAPGGRLGLIWNLRDEREDWVRRLGEIINSPELYRPSELGTPFGPVETRDFGWTHEIGLDRLLDLVASRSYVIMLDAADRAAVLDRVRHLTATHPDLAGRDTFALPYVTQCARADLSQR